MKLYLVQHGDAVPKETDPERPLSDQGRQDVQSLAAVLKRAGIAVQRLLHSGKHRAEQTAHILAAAVLEQGAAQAVPGIAPGDDATVFAQTVNGWDRDTLVVGHLPFLARLVALLLCGDPGRELVCYRPGSVVCLERSASGGWCVNWMLRPELAAVLLRQAR